MAVKRFLMVALFIALALSLSGCDGLIPDKYEISTTSELGPNTLERIDRVNDTLATGIEIGPQTRGVIEDLNRTISDGIKVGFTESTLQRVDTLLRVVEDGLKVGLDRETLDTIDGLIGTIDRAPGQWEGAATQIIQQLERSAGTTAGQMATEIKGVLQEARLNSQQLIGTFGVEFRCNVDFMGSRVNSSVSEFIGKSLIGRLRDIMAGRRGGTEVPTPWVCNILPDTVELVKMDNKLAAKKDIINIAGYNYVDANLPKGYLVDESGRTLGNITLLPFRKSAYELQVPLQGIDFTPAVARSRIEFRWPNVSDKTAIAVILPTPSKPTADFVADNRSIKAGTVVTFTDKSFDGPTSWSWDFGDGGTSRDQSPRYKYERAGKFTVTLTVSNAQGSDTIRKADFIEVTPGPTGPTADFKADRTTGQVPLTVAFTDLSTGDSTSLSWRWDFGDGTAVSTARNPTHTYSVPGRYTVKLTATNAYGSDSEEKNAYINAQTAPPPPPDLTVVSITSEPAVKVERQNVKVTVNVKNQGSGPASAFTLEWKPSPTYSGPLHATTVPGLNANEPYSYPFNYAYPDDGTFSSLATVDPENKIVETNESNNSRSYSITVQPAPVPTTRITVSGNVPITDDESWPMSDEHGTLTFNQSLTLQANQTSSELSYNKCVGDEVRFEIYMKFYVRADLNARVTGKAILYEGTDCDPDNNRAEKPFEFDVPANRVAVPWNYTLTWSGGDSAKINLSITNSPQ